MGTEPVDYCREIETYLCRKNDGHLIRVVGPSFARVSHWEQQGIPLKIAFAGIDRYCERYYRQGPRRRPVKIDFCEADVLDVFDEWKRATGVVQPAVGSRQAAVDSRQSAVGTQQSGGGRRESLPDHLERAVIRLTSARARGIIGERFDAVIDAAARELDAARGPKGGLRGEARHAMIERLVELDRQLVATARDALSNDVTSELRREVDAELAPFHAAMPADAYARACEAAFDRLVRERLALPIIAYWS